MSTAATQFENGEEFAAENDRTPLPLRGDTFLGVFEAIGQDLGISPNWLRVPFAALILWNPMAIIGAYLALGAIVAAARWYFPRQKAAAAPAQRANGEVEAENELEEERLAA